MSAEPPEIGSNQSVSTQTDPPTLITHLPDDALCRCLATVPFRDRAVIVRVCKSWRNTVASRAFAVARRELAEPLWLVIGGQTSANFNDYIAEAMSNQCRIFDASLQPVARLKSLPRPSLESGAATIPGLGVLLLGGWDGDDSTDQFLTEASWVHNMDPSSSWRRWADLPGRFAFLKCCALGDYIYAVSDYFIGNSSDARKLFCFDKQGNLLKTWEWPDDTSPEHLLVLDDRLVVVDESMNSRMHSFDPETGTWLRLPDPPLSSSGGTGVVSLSGKIYVMGGSRRRDGHHGPYGDVSADVHIFDGHEWSAGPPLPFPAKCTHRGAIASADSIIFLTDCVYTQWDQGCIENSGCAFVLRGGTWHTHADAVGYDKIGPRCAITPYCA